MSGIDFIIIIVALAYTGIGAIRGFARSAAELVGITVGGIGALLLFRLLFGNPSGTNAMTDGIIFAGGVAMILFMAITGQVIGSAVGKRLTRERLGKVFGAVNATLGAALSAVVAGALAWVLAFAGSIGSAPVSSQTIASSSILTKIDQMVPESASNRLLGLSSSLLEGGFDHFAAPLVSADPDLDIPADEQAMTSGTAKNAKSSVLRISGVMKCNGFTATGTGFVYDNDLIMTNAHVVAGIPKPIVHLNGKKKFAKVVAFDPATDLAVLRVADLGVQPLEFDLTGRRGDTGVVVGYPGGGDYDARGALIQREIIRRGPDVYGQNMFDRDVFVTGATVRPGNSGGPLLSDDGKVIGVVFATSTQNGEVGFALTAKQASAVAEQGRVSTANLASKTDCAIN